MTVIIHELKQNRKLFIIWTLVVAGFTYVFMLLFPQMASQMEGMADIYANMGGFSAAFGMDKMNFATAMGFYGIEAGAMLSIGGGMLAAILGGNMLCKEEGKHTAEFLFTMPVKRETVVLQKMAAAGILILVFNGICLAGGIGAFLSIGEDIEWKNLLLYHCAQLFMQLEVAMLCLAVSAFLKKVSMGIGIGVSLLLYFLQMFVNISDEASFLKYVTPFYYSDAANIFPNGEAAWGLILLGMGYGIVAVAVAVFKYRRKDLAA